MKWFFRRRKISREDGDAVDRNAFVIAGRLLGLQLRLSRCLAKIALKAGHRRSARFVVAVCVLGLVYCLYLVLNGILEGC